MLMFNLGATFLFVLLAFCALSLLGDDNPTVATSLGRVRGTYLKSASGRKFSAFRGIPYAQPPLGSLRFKDPLPLDSWGNQALDATQEGPICVQPDFSLNGTSRGQEDCLKLNVYTHDMNPGKSGLKPVMVYIHGGAFVSGSGNGETGFCGPNYFLDRDIVLVTINYRLGVLGFMSTWDDEAPGNYGLLDQTLALKWVRGNIIHFGGDPKSVTIFGNSAGGASVEYHILSPLSTGLFDRAIAQSGSTLCSWATQKKGASEYTKKLALDFGCPLKTSSEFLECLRGKKAEDFGSFAKKMRQMLNNFPLVSFGPRVDIERKSPFLPAPPLKLIEESRFHSVPYIMGMTANEGAFIVAKLLAKDGKPMQLLQEDPVQYIPLLLDFEFDPSKEAIAKKLMTKYFNSTKPFKDQLEAIEKMSSDIDFFRGIDESVHLFSQNSNQPVYYYNYAHRGQFQFHNLQGAPSDVELGAGHVDDVLILFSNNVFPLITNFEDLKVSNLLIDLWTSFATIGIPQSEVMEGEWLPLDRSEKTRYLNIVAHHPRMINQSMPFHDRISFLNHLFDSRRTVTEL